MQYQSLEATESKIIKMYSKNPNRSISGTFRSLRKQQRTSLFGDYPILITIINLCISPTRFQVTHALKQSSELGNISKSFKTELLNQLINPLYVQTRLAKNTLGKTKNINMTHTSS